MSNVITLVQGEDRTLTFTLKEVDSNGVTTYMDLTGATEIELRAADSGSGFVFFKLTLLEIEIVDAKGGVFKATMSDTKTALLKLGQQQNLEVIIDFGSPSAGDRRIAQLFKAITVVKRLYP